MRTGQIELDKWHFKLGLVYTWYSRHYMFHFGIFKLLSYPPEGEIYTKKNYKGFWFRRDIFSDGFEISYIWPK
jgi:hypothetical protein